MMVSGPRIKHWRMEVLFIMIEDNSLGILAPQKINHCPGSTRPSECISETIIPPYKVLECVIISLWHCKRLLAIDQLFKSFLLTVVSC